MRKKRSSSSKKGRRKPRLKSNSSGKIKFRVLAVAFTAFALLIVFFIARDFLKKKPQPAPKAKSKVVRTQAPRVPAPERKVITPPPTPAPQRPEPRPPEPEPIRTDPFKGVPFTQEEVNKPKIVLVIDDIGYHKDFENELRALGTDITYAILPMLPFSEYFGQVGGEVGTEVILHQPLESINGTIPGRGLITTAMPPEQMLSVLNTNLDNVPNHVGINNHMGSLGTITPMVMETVLGEVKQRGLLFLDSRTNSKTIGPRVAKKLGITILVRDVFLDNEDSKPYILRQLRQVEPIAEAQGYAIAIGHYRKKTLELLADEIPKLKRKGFAIVSLKKIAAMKENGLL